MHQKLAWGLWTPFMVLQSCGRPMYRRAIPHSPDASKARLEGIPKPMVPNFCSTRVGGGCTRAIMTQKYPSTYAARACKLLVMLSRSILVSLCRLSIRRSLSNYIAIASGFLMTRPTISRSPSPPLCYTTPAMQARFCQVGAKQNPESERSRRQMLLRSYPAMQGSSLLSRG